ncbi:polysaccharide deacetylase family protein [Luteimonas sp. 8-5]|uniref:polysaccharide deacetylase family protein n=1 Tax=Luteimonas sp. 8-5 TaxID=3039387 RepID=UPI0024372CF0|nr:polysaccharide deacetylase family protein [Luteimonas sp. 8-5]MDG6348293.1 polysaccharide deacetylase family protein [Luteimonas sp. 8-5]
MEKHKQRIAKRVGWLAQILSERFGVEFDYAIADGVSWISIPGSEGRIEFVCSKAFSAGASPPGVRLWDPEREGWKAPLGAPIPMPGMDCVDGATIIERRSYGFRVLFDVIGFASWMLSREEEIGATDLDEHGRFPATASHAFQHGYLERPVVDEWLEVVRQLAVQVWPGLPISMPRFSVEVSHDVDTPSRYAFTTPVQFAKVLVGDVIKRHQILNPFFAPYYRQYAKRSLHPRDPANTFDWIMDKSDAYRIRSAFYFICGRTDPTRDARYNLEDPAIRELLRRIHGRGHEIGLHCSYRSFQNPAVIEAEARCLRRVCNEEGISQLSWGGRMHFLRWETPTTLLSLDAAGMAYDSSMTYADRPGFRCGTCFEYPGFDPIGNRVLGVRVRPLIAMECTVMAPRYMGLGIGSSSLAMFMRLMQACRAVGGAFTLLWHNTELEDTRKKKLYEAILQGATD